MNKITISADAAFIIRSVRNMPDTQRRTMYCSTPTIQVSNPLAATLFTLEETAAAHLLMMLDRDTADLSCGLRQRP